MKNSRIWMNVEKKLILLYIIEISISILLFFLLLVQWKIGNTIDDAAINIGIVLVIVRQTSDVE